MCYLTNEKLLVVDLSVICLCFLKQAAQSSGASPSLGKLIRRNSPSNIAFTTTALANVTVVPAAPLSTIQTRWLSAQGNLMHTQGLVEYEVLLGLWMCVL